MLRYEARRWQRVRPLSPAICAFVGLGLGLHVGAQNGINASLVAATLLLEPFHNIMVNPDRQAVLWFRHGEFGFLPKRFIQLGDIGVVDLLITHFAQTSKVSLALCPRSSAGSRTLPFHCDVPSLPQYFA